MAWNRAFTTTIKFFNDPAWMDFDGPSETVAPIRIPQLDPVGTPFPIIDVTSLAVPSTQPICRKESPGDPIMSSSGRPLQQQHGYRRGNSDNTYHHQQSSSRYSSYPNTQSRNRTDWDDIHLPNYEGFSDSEFERSRTFRSAPRGYPNTRYAQSTQNSYSYNAYRYEQSTNYQRSRRGPKRIPPCNISYLSSKVDQNKKDSKETQSNKINSEDDDQLNKTNEDKSPLSVDIKDLVTNLSYMNQKNDGKVFNTKFINSNNNESDNNKDCDQDTGLLITIPLLLDNSRKTKRATLALPETTNSNTTEVPMELESPSSVEARSPLFEIADTSESHYNDTIENPSNKDNTILFDADLEANPQDNMGPPILKSKIEIKMDILLSPPKIVFNPNPLQIHGDDEAPFENQPSAIIDLFYESDDDANVDQSKQSDKVPNKDVGASNLNEKNDEQSASVKRKQRTSSCDYSANRKYRKIDEKAYCEIQPQSKSSKKQNSSSKQSQQHEMTTDAANGQNKIKKLQKAESKTKETPNEQIKKDELSVKRGNKTKLINNKEKVQSNNKKRESGNQKHGSGTKESKSTVIEKNENSSVKDYAKPSDESVAKNKNNTIIGQRRNSCVDKPALGVQKNLEIQDSEDTSDVTILNNNSPKEADSQTNMFESLRKNNTFLSNTRSYDPAINIDANLKMAMLEKQNASSDFGDALTCDYEIDRISFRTAAKIRNRRLETKESTSPFVRSKSVDRLREDSTSFERYSPVKITKRRRTIIDASELSRNKGEISKRGRRLGSRNRPKYSKDPSFKGTGGRASTPCRITRSKSKVLTRAYMDAVVPKFPDDPDFYARMTPPATPRTPRHEDTPEIVRNLNTMFAGGDNSSLSIDEESQVMNHVYAPLFIDEQQESDNHLVDKVTLHNTMANKVSPPEDLSQSAQVVLNMLTDDDIRSLKDNLTEDKTPEQIGELESITLYANRIACSISIASIGLHNNVDIDQLLKEMDAAPRPTKEPIPKVRKIIDPRINNLLIDNAITVPLSNKHHPQTSAPKPFNPYATVSADNHQSPLTTKQTKSSKEQLNRLFNAEAKQICMVKQFGKDKQELFSKNKGPHNATAIPKKSNKEDLKQEALKNIYNKKSILLLRHNTYETIAPFVEEDTVPLLDDGADLSQATTIIQLNTHLDQANVLPLVISTTFETIKSLPEISEDDIVNLDESFDNDVALPDNVKGETTTSSSVNILYDKPTLVATIDLYAKPDDEDCEIKPVDISIHPPQSNSIIIVSVEEYSMNVTSAIGQYIQMEKIYFRTVDLVQKCTTSFARETIECDDSVHEFKKSYTAKLATKFIDYTDSIEIQNFSVTILYTTLTNASLQYNGIKIKKYDVAKAICDFYNAIGNQHLRSVFCKQLYQLSNHMMDIELTNERNQIQQHPPNGPNNQSPDNNSVSIRQSDSQCTLDSISTCRLNPSTSPSSINSISKPIVANAVKENISPRPIIPSNTAAEVLASIGRRTSEIEAPITPVPSTPTVPRISESIASPVTQKTFESRLLLNGSSVTQFQESPAHNQRGNVEFQPIINLINQQPFIANITSTHVSQTVVLNQGQQSTLPIQTQQSTLPVQSQQPTLPIQSPPNALNKRRIKYTAPINQHSLADLLNGSSEFLEQFTMYNKLVNNYHALKKLGTSSVASPTAVNYKQSTNASNKTRVVVASTFLPSPSSSNNFAKPTTKSPPVNICNKSASSTGNDLRTLLNYRPDSFIRSNKNSPFNKPDAKSAENPIPSAVNNPIPILSQVCSLPTAIPESNVRISVRNMNHLLQSSIEEVQKKQRNKRRDNAKEQSVVIDGITSLPIIPIGEKNLPSAQGQGKNDISKIQLMITQIDEAATQSCIAEANKQQQKGDYAGVCSLSKDDDSSPQIQDPIVRNLSRDSGNSSVDRSEEFRDLVVDISCICGKTADKICSCKLIVYCSENCQAEDWARHSVDHVEV